MALMPRSQATPLLPGLHPTAHKPLAVRGSFTCSLLLLFSKPGFFFFLMGLVDESWGEWPLEEWGGLGNFRFWAVRSVEPGSERDTEDHVSKAVKEAWVTWRGCEGDTVTLSPNSE